MELSINELAQKFWTRASLPVRTVVAWHNLDARMPEVNRAWNKVRNELAEVGLLDEGVYLDQIDLAIAFFPSLEEAGYVYESMDWSSALVGYEEGVIYLPSDLPKKAYVPGGTLTDVIRHEYGHAWHWLDAELFDQEWFEKAFGANYEEEDSIPYREWEERIGRSRKYNKKIESTKTEAGAATVFRKFFLDEFVSDYAATNACEDFAETFMTCLRCRNSLDRFRNRKGVFRKLKAVERIVKSKSKQLGLG